MTEKLGVLLVDVPEPKLFCYEFLMDVKINRETFYTTAKCDYLVYVIDEAYKCTKEEAKKYPQFKWVSLEELE